MHRRTVLFCVLRGRCNIEAQNPERSRDILYAQRRKHSPCSSIVWSFREFAEHMVSSLDFLEARGRTEDHGINFCSF